MGRGTKIGLATAIMGTALVGGWLVRAHDRSEPPRAEEAVAAPVEPSSAPVAPVVATPPPVTTAPAATSVAPAAARSASVARTRTRSDVAPASPVRARPSVMRRAPRPPAAEPIEDEAPEPIEHEAPEPPDFDPDSADVVRPRDDATRDPFPEGASDTEDRRVTGRGDIAARLERAEQRRDAVAARVSRLRDRANASVVTDVEEYQRVQEQLEAALEQQDRLEAQVARLRRALERRE